MASLTSSSVIQKAASLAGMVLVAQLSWPSSTEAVPGAGGAGWGFEFTDVTAVLDPWILYVMQFAVREPPFLLPELVSPEEISG